MKRINYIQLFSVLLLAFLISQCYYDEVLPEPVAPTDKEISFQADILPIFDASCNSSGCHNTGEIAPDLTAGSAYNSLQNGNYINIEVPEESELYLWMNDQRDLSMPLTGPNASYNATVLQWIQQGALNN